MKKRKYLLLFLILLLTFGCGEPTSSKTDEDEKTKIKMGPSSENKEKEEKDEKKSDNDSTKTLVSYDKKISIKVPKDWKILPKGELNETAVIEAMGNKEDKYLMVITDDAKDFSSSEEWEMAAINMLSEVYGVNKSKFVDATINGYSGKNVDFNFLEGNTQIYMRIYLLELEETYAQVYLWTVASSKTEYSKEFYDIIKTISIEKS